MRPRGLVDEEVSALRRLYVATSGENWTNSGRWLNKDPTSWYGTTWQEIDGCTRLVKLLLSNNCLTGELPEIWGTFKHLRVLNLDNNNLTGALPVQIGWLTELTCLDLSSNELGPEIPGSYGTKCSHPRPRLPPFATTTSVPRRLAQVHAHLAERQPHHSLGATNHGQPDETQGECDPRLFLL